MKRSLLVIFVLVASLLLVACTTDSPTQDTTDQAPIEDKVENEDDEVEYDIEEEPIDDEDISEDEDTPNEDGFAYIIDNIEEFELEIELINDQEIDYDFHRSDNEAKVTREDDEQMNLTGDEARDEIFNLLENIEITLDRTLDDMLDEVLDYLNISRDDIDEFELEVEFLDSKEIDFKYDRAEGSENRESEEFDLEIDFWDGSEWDFEYDLSDNEFEIEGRENLQGEEARTRIEELIEAMDVSMDRSIREIKDKLFNHLGINEEDVEDFDLDIEYVDGAEIDVKVHY